MRRNAALALRTAVSVVMISCLVSPAAGGASLAGRVRDYSITDEQAAGLGGVEIRVYEGDTELEKDATDPQGYYKLAELPKDKDIKVTYSLAGYRQRPTVYNIKLENDGAEHDVDLIPEQDNGKAYYDQIATSFVARSSQTSYEKEWKTLESFDLPDDVFSGVKGTLEVKIGVETVRRLEKTKASAAVLKYDQIDLNKTKKLKKPTEPAKPPAK